MLISYVANNMPKPVTLSIEFKLPEGAQIAKASILPNGDFLFLDAQGNQVVPVYMNRTLQYERVKGPKVQNRATFESDLASVGGLNELTKFDAIFALDTNTRLIEGDRVSATAFLCCSVRTEGDQFRLQCEPQVNVYEFHNVGGNPERLGLLKVAKDVVRSKDYSPRRRFALVTDSDLGAHAEINSFRAPLYGNHLLPQCFQLVYGSSDTGRELLNRLIRFCDRQAARYLQFYEEGSLTPKELLSLAEDPSIKYAYRFLRGLEVLNPIMSGSKLGSGSTFSLYGRKKS